MHLNFGKDFVILRVVGLFIGSMLAIKVYEIYRDYHPGAMSIASTGEVLSLLAGLFIVGFSFTFSWKLDLSTRGVLSTYGFLLWHKEKLYTTLEYIRFKLDFIEVKNGPDKAYISVELKPAGRDRSYPICSLYQESKSIIWQSYYTRKHREEIKAFKVNVNRLLELYPGLPIDVDDKIPAFYEAITSDGFNWQR